MICVLCLCVLEQRYEQSHTIRGGGGARNTLKKKRGGGARNTLKKNLDMVNLFLPYVYPSILLLSQNIKT